MNNCINELLGGEIVEIQTNDGESVLVVRVEDGESSLLSFHAMDSVADFIAEEACEIAKLATHCDRFSDEFASIALQAIAEIVGVQDLDDDEARDMIEGATSALMEFYL